MQCFCQKLNQPIDTNSKINGIISYTKNYMMYNLCSEIFAYNDSFKFNTSFVVIHLD